MTGILKLGLVGKGIGRSQSPRLHRRLGELFGLEVTYDLLDPDQLGAFDLAQRLTACAAEGYRGVNVTHPFKQEAFGLATSLGRTPAGLTSFNTVLLESGGWRGSNTDYSGFMAAWRARFGDRKPGRTVLAGAGGVGIALAFALAALGGEPVIHDLEPARASLLAERLSEEGLPARVSQGGLAEAMSGADGLVNATPLGMAQYPGDPFPLAALGGQAWAFDAVYTPAETGFIAACRARGLNCMTGFDLFFYQGVDAFEIFSGRRPDADSLAALYRDFSGRQKSA